MRVLGMISGTSHDGIDAAVVDLDLDAGGSGPERALRLRMVGTDTISYDPGLRARLVAAMPPEPSTVDEVCRLDTAIGQAFAEVAATMIERHGALDLISSHGQTVYHWVEGDHALGSLQLGQPAWIAERTGTPVVADLRLRDITAGGHGAPLVPLLDEWLLAGSAEPAASLNLGGISNVTIVRPDGPSIAYDIGPANALVDAVVQDRGLDPRGFDTAGSIAAGGRVDSELLQQLLADPYYRRPAPKSTGKEHFNLAYVRDQVADRRITDADLIATLTRLSAETVAHELVAAGVRRVIAAGGGTRNPVLMGWLAELAEGVEVTNTDELGIPADTKEAIAFALMGWCSWHGLPGNVPSATGASGPRILGALIPGRQPLRLPEPLESLPGLVIER